MTDRAVGHPDQPIFHLAVRAEWDAAVAAGEYVRSTIDRSLVEEGFIHASFADQVRDTADRFYRDRDDVVLLHIDPAALRAEVRVEDLYETGIAFPHIYGPLPVEAVVSARPVPLRGDGTLDVAPLLTLGPL
jgi:uncharacterized protein (DUF952 family)